MLLCGVGCLVFVFDLIIPQFCLGRLLGICLWPCVSVSRGLGVRLTVAVSDGCRQSSSSSALPRQCAVEPINTPQSYPRK